LLAPFFIYRNAYLKQCLEHADAIISPSAFVKQKLVENGYAAHRIRVSDYGLRTDVLADYRFVPADHLRVGYIGTILPHKGVDVLVKAFNQLDDARAELKIYGNLTYDPGYADQVKALARHPGIRFMGEIDNAEVGRALSGIDVLVVPSLWYENSPINIHEAQLVGVPVIASNIGGMVELVRNEIDGLLFRVGDPDDLARQLRRLIADPDLLDRLQADIEPVKTIAENAREMEALYEELLEARRPILATSGL